MNIKVLITIASFVLLIGCEKEPTITFGFADSVLTEGMIAKLEEKDIWFRKESNGRITIYEKDKALVEQVGAEVGDNILPTGRSVSVNKYMQKEILAELDMSGVSYKIVSFGAENLPSYASEVGMSSEYIVFAEGHEENGLRIFEEFVRNVDPEKYIQHR